MSGSPPRSRFSKPSWARQPSNVNLSSSNDALFARPQTRFDEIVLDDSIDLDGPANPLPKRPHQELETDQGRPGKRQYGTHLSSASPAPQPRYQSSINLDSTDEDESDAVQVSCTVSRSVADARVDAHFPGRPPLSPVESDIQDGSDDELSAIMRTVRKAQKPAASLVDTSAVSADPIPENRKFDFLISSSVLEVPPLIVRLREDQPFRELREVWCKTNDVPPETAATAFLVHCRRRLFDIMKPADLGIPPVAELEKKTKDGIELDESGSVLVHLEIVSRLQYEEIRKKAVQASIAESKEQTIEDSLDLDGEDGPDEADQAADEKPAAAQANPNDGRLRIILRSKAYKEFKVMAKQDTTVAALIEAFSNTFELTAEQRASARLVLDGESLGPDSTVEDADLEDMDSLDVHFAATADVVAAARADRDAREKNSVVLDDNEPEVDSDADPYAHYVARGSTRRRGPQPGSRGAPRGAPRGRARGGRRSRARR